MKLAEHGIVPPKEWEHDPNIKSEYKFYYRFYDDYEYMYDTIARCFM